MATKPRNTVTINPLGPATERQKALMVTLNIPFEPDCTKQEAETLLEASKPWGPKPQGDNKPAKRRAIYRARHVRGYLTRAELAANIGKITEEVRDQLMGRFVDEAGQAYEALSLARDDPDPKVRGEALKAAIHHLDRVMGRMTQDVELKGGITVNLVSKIPRPEAKDNGNDS